MESSPPLVRALRASDLTWLYLVAIVNLNVIPVIAGEGPPALWLWLAVIACFFLPQGIAVIELSGRMPGEGGLYLWTKETWGDFHGFLCGWCYWLTNMFFIPALLFYLTGVTTYIGGTAAAGLNDSRLFFWLLTTALLWSTILANIHGLGVGKWVNNIGGIGSLAIGIALSGLAVASLIGHASALEWRTVQLPRFAALPVSKLGVMCLAMVGLEIGPVMGDEVRDPERTIPRGILCGGILCVIIYLCSTASLLVGLPKSEIAVVQGMLQAVDQMSHTLGWNWILLPLAILMAASIAGSTSAWVSGSARILFVSGLDRYLPRALGKVHPRYGSPHVALAMFGVLASAIIAMSFIGASVKEAYLTLLDLSVALQMISYLYLFLAFARAAFTQDAQPRRFSRIVLRAASAMGLLATAVALGMAFVPSRQIKSVWSFESKMILTLILFLGMARVLFVYYSRRKPRFAQVTL